MNLDVCVLTIEDLSRLQRALNTHVNAARDLSIELEGRYGNECGAVKALREEIRDCISLGAKLVRMGGSDRG